MAIRVHRGLSHPSKSKKWFLSVQKVRNPIFVRQSSVLRFSEKRRKKNKNGRKIQQQQCTHEREAFAMLLRFGKNKKKPREEVSIGSVTVFSFPFFSLLARKQRTILSLHFAS